jgi:carboxymethylenebutenolidase
VAFYGGVSPWRIQGVESEMPPTLLVHGSADRIVPVWRSVEAAEFLRTAGCEADVVVYPRVRHGFGLNSRGGIDRAAARDAWERAVAFLECQLRSPEADGGDPCSSWVEREPAAVRALLNPSLDEVRRAALSSGRRTAGS